MGSPLCFWLAASCCVVCALGVVIFRPPLYSALALAGALLSTALLFINLQAHLAAGIQVMVYAGAILVLIVFTIMLLNLRSDSSREGHSPAALQAGIVLGAVCILAMVQWLATRGAPPAAVDRQFGTAAGVGHELFGHGSPFIYPFEITSVLLLAAIIGAVTLGKRR